MPTETLTYSDTATGPGRSVRIERALISVSDKTGLADFAGGLNEFGIDLISTSGTATAMSDVGLDVISVEEITRFPEMLNGRVKTFHPYIQAGLLFDPEDKSHQKVMAEHKQIKPIGLVCVNLYPFEATIQRPDASREEIIEKIDIGGPTMIRAAAKNHRYVTVVVDPRRYPQILAELSATNGEISADTRRELAQEAFAHTAHYEAVISHWFSRHSEE